MKKLMSVVFLISAINMQAMDKPQPEKKTETIEELIQKAARLMAEEQIQQFKKEEEKKQEPNLKEAFYNFMGALTTEAQKAGTKLKIQMDNLMKEVSTDTIPCSFENNMNEAVNTAKTGWDNFKKWLETEEQEQFTVNIMTLHVVENKEEDTKTDTIKKAETKEETISLKDLNDQQIAFFKAMIEEARNNK